MTNPVCQKTGSPMRCVVRPMALNYKGESITFDMPGWYCESSDESIHTGEDMRVSDRMLIPCKVAISSETGNDFVENPSEEIISHRVRRDRKKGFRD